MNDYLLKHHFPEDLKTMDMDELELLSFEIRDFLVETVSRSGGHLASNLGVVELAIALHRTFDAPRDKLIWDVGHQSYVHKILTGRADQFDSLRQLDGLSGFPKRCESEYDVFDTGHSSTSIGLGLGMAIARDRAGEDYHVVSVIGDGAMTGGAAFEALNNAGQLNSDLIVVLNDNGMSIAPNTGGLSRHLVKLSSTEKYNALKASLKRGMSRLPVIGDDLVSGLQSAKDRIKYAVIEGIVFEELGFKYIGPVDGHNIKELCQVLEMARAIDGPVLVHTLTTKGKGYSHAEEQPDIFHGIGPFDPETGRPESGRKSPSWSGIAGQTLTELAEDDPRIIAVSAAMIDGTGMNVFRDRFPDRIFDTGIAEGHAATFAAGLAAAGDKPFVVVYSTFLQRAFDQILEDVCLQDLPVTFCLDRAGVVGADGETHHGIFDVSYLRAMPNLTLLAPADGEQLKEMLAFAAKWDGPCAIRYPRGEAKAIPGLPEFVRGKAQKLREGTDVSIWALGPLTAHALEAADILAEKGISASVVNIGTASPLDTALLEEDAASHRLIATIEDNVLSGGIGEAIGAHLNGGETKHLAFGWPDTFIEHGKADELYRRYAMDGQSVAERIAKELEGQA
ncbi:MAG: 1-deoxy-D-xylulose-5-phosphate synthase [Firmicutes bacterium]|nr:1-deoxy-D-xylulose-5-phosphate synthase [Bacillota bacterium]